MLLIQDLIWSNEILSGYIARFYYISDADIMYCRERSVLLAGTWPFPQTVVSLETCKVPGSIVVYWGDPSSNPHGHDDAYR